MFPSLKPRTITARELAAAGLLEIGPRAQVSPAALFEPEDDLGGLRQIVIGADCRVLAGAVIHGGVHLGDGTRVEEHAVVGTPERGYAVGRSYPGSGAATAIAAGAVIRSGAILYAGVQIGEDTVVGHHTLLRSFVTVGAGSQLGHHLTIERQTVIGADVRCSPLSHITSSTVLGDRVFLGAGIRTVNDKHLIWKDPDRAPDLSPPRFEHDCRVGSGSTVMAGVVIGAGALIGAASLVTRDIPAGAVAFGVPATVRGTADDLLARRDQS